MHARDFSRKGILQLVLCLVLGSKFLKFFSHDLKNMVWCQAWCWHDNDHSMLKSHSSLYYGKSFLNKEHSSIVRLKNYVKKGSFQNHLGSINNYCKSRFLSMFNYCMIWRKGGGWGGMARSYKYIFCTCNKKVYASVLPEMLLLMLQRQKMWHIDLLLNQLSFHWTLLIRLFMGHLLTLLFILFRKLYFQRRHAPIAMKKNILWSIYAIHARWDYVLTASLHTSLKTIM